MQLIIEFKTTNVPLTIKENCKEVLEDLIRNDNRLVYKAKDISLDEDYSNIKSIQITFE
ncbi:hypothetical protein [Priestia megaterium]